jgi:hypothetical protein
VVVDREGVAGRGPGGGGPRDEGVLGAVAAAAAGLRLGVAGALLGLFTLGATAAGCLGSGGGSDDIGAKNPLGSETADLEARIMPPINDFLLSATELGLLDDVTEPAATFASLSLAAFASLAARSLASLAFLAARASSAFFSFSALSAAFFSLSAFFS